MLVVLSGNELTCAKIYRSACQLFLSLAVIGLVAVGLVESSWRRCAVAAAILLGAGCGGGHGAEAVEAAAAGPPRSPAR